MSHLSKPNNEESFWSKVHKTDSCWIWTGCVHNTGYGRISMNGRNVFTHRYVMPDIPDGMTVDHLCGNKLCVNPSHLEIVSRGENARRYWLSRDRCKYGHEFTSENTRLDTKGRRRCRACGRRYFQERSQRLKEIAK